MAKTNRVILTIPAIPPSLNVYQAMHWAKRNSEKKMWAEYVYYAWVKAGRPKFEKVNIQVTYFFKTRHKRDQDNYNAKWLVDPLKHRAIVDDSSDYVTHLPPIFEYDKENPRTEIFLKELG